MSTARKVLMIISFIVSIIAIIVFAMCGVGLFISINNEELLKRLLEGFNKASLSIEDGKTFVMILGVVFAIFTFLEIINACLSIKGVKSSRAGLMVLNIIFGVISGIYINSLGGIFGLVDGKKD